MPDSIPCRDCGLMTDRWWLAWTHPGSASRRCRPCYNAYSNAAYHRRRAAGTQKPAPSAAKYAKRDRCELAPCEDCGRPARPFRQSFASTLCLDCRAIRTTKRRGVATARRRMAEALGDRISWQELGVRDGWKCHICGGRVRQLPGGAHQPFGSTVDHLIPVAKGGDHKWHNVALAHRRCNTSRGASGTVQLRLVG